MRKTVNCKEQSQGANMPRVNPVYHPQVHKYLYQLFKQIGMHKK